jgi:acyl carrier protein
MTSGLTVAPASGTETIFAEVLADIVGVERVSVDSHFFDDLGADSLVMAQFCARVRKRGDLPPVSMKDIYAQPTIRSLATSLADEEATSIESPAPVPTEVAAPAGTPQYILCGALQFLFVLGYWYGAALAITQGYEWISAGSGAIDVYLRSVLFKPRSERSIASSAPGFMGNRHSGAVALGSVRECRKSRKATLNSATEGTGAVRLVRAWTAPRAGSRGGWSLGAARRRPPAVRARADGIARASASSRRRAGSPSRHRYLLVLGHRGLDRLANCPSIEDIDVDQKCLRRQSHIGITDDPGRAAERLMARAAERAGSLGHCKGPPSPNPALFPAASPPERSPVLVHVGARTPRRTSGQRAAQPGRR